MKEVNFVKIIKDGDIHAENWAHIEANLFTSKKERPPCKELPTEVEKVTTYSGSGKIVCLVSLSIFALTTAAALCIIVAQHHDSNLNMSLALTLLSLIKAIVENIGRILSG